MNQQHQVHQQEQQQQEQKEEISQELITKFDGDKQLVQQFLDQGYSQEELLKSSILHPTKMDPVCILENGEQIGMWLYANNSHYSNKGVSYSNYTYEQFRAAGERRRS